MPRATLLATASLALLLSPSALRAETFHTCHGTIASVPATITTQGVWCLDRDFGTGLGSGAAIDIDTNNVTLDCNGFKLGNLAAGTGTGTVGIRALGRANVTIRNCNLRGFARAIHLEGGIGGHVVEDNRIEAARMVAIATLAGPATLRRNRIVDTGGSSVQTDAALAIGFEGSVEIVDNVIDGFVVPGAAVECRPTGIKGVDEGQSRIERNLVRGMHTADVLDTAMGIDVYGYGTLVADNILGGAGSDIGYGVRCLVGLQTFVRGNIVSGFAEAIDFECIADDNVVVP